MLCIFGVPKIPMEFFRTSQQYFVLGVAVCHTVERELASILASNSPPRLFVTSIRGEILLAGKILPSVIFVASKATD